MIKRASLYMFALLMNAVLSSYICDLDLSFQRLISKSFEPFSMGITQQMIGKAKDWSDNNICVVRIHDHKIISDCLWNEHRCLMQAVARHVPDLQFVLNYDDRPRIYKHNCSEPSNSIQCACDANYSQPQHAYLSQWHGPIGVEKVPLFSQSTISQCFYDILFPSYIHLDNRFRKRNRVAWQKKVFKAIWRGSTTGSWCNDWQKCRSFHRQRLVERCHNITACDAGFNLFVQCNKEACAGMKSFYGESSSVDFMSQKLVIDIDGNSYSGRFPYLLEAGAVVLKISAYEDLVTKVTTAWQHYIPVRMDLTDLEQKIEWAKNNDKALRQISERASLRSQQVLTLRSYQCYVINLLKKYHSLLISVAKPVTDNLQHN